MFFTLLESAPGTALAWIVVILISLTVHEFAHAYIGSIKGDSTAEMAGRLTLNPLAHIDWIGFIPLLLLGFGWAKPVPFNPYNLKDPKNDALHIALAGPFSNLFLAILAGVVFRILEAMGALTGLLPVFLLLMIIINLFLLFFNLIPVHPLDGSKIIDALLIRPQHQKLLYNIKYYGPRVLMVMVILSLFTNFDVFFFVSTPSFATCSALLGENCQYVLLSVF